MTSNGVASFSGFTNQAAGFSTGFGEFNPGDGRYKNGFATTDPAQTLPAGGPYRLASLTITGTSGTPQVDIVAILAGSPDPTFFGTHCVGVDQTSVYLLGTDWRDTDGVKAFNVPPSLSAPSSVTGEAGSDVVIEVDATDSLSQTAPSITADGYPGGLTLRVVQTAPNASRATLSGQLGTNDAGTHTIEWTATDEGGLESRVTTVMDVSSQSAITASTIIGYSTVGPGPITVAEGPQGIDATLGPWDGPLYSNGPCGEPMAYPVTDYVNQLTVEIDVGSGGKVGFTYRLSETGTPFHQECLSISLYHGTGVKPLLECWGNPQACWGSVWQSPRKAMIVDLDDYANQHVYLVFAQGGLANFGTETQARVQSLAITECPLPSLAPLAPDDQALEDQPWDEAHLTPAMQAALNCFRNGVRNTGGVFDTTYGSAYRTLGYQLHLREVWDTYKKLRDRPIPECQSLWTTIQSEMTKHRIRSRPVDCPHSSDQWL